MANPLLLAKICCCGGGDICACMTRSVTLTFSGITFPCAQRESGFQIRHSESEFIVNGTFSIASSPPSQGGKSLIQSGPFRVPLCDGSGFAINYQNRSISITCTDSTVGVFQGLSGGTFGGLPSYFSGSIALPDESECGSYVIQNDLVTNPTGPNQLGNLGLGGTCTITFGTA